MKINNKLIPSANKEITLEKNFFIYESVIDASEAIAKTIISDFRKNSYIKMGISYNEINKGIYDYLASVWEQNIITFKKATCFILTEFENEIKEKNTFLSLTNDTFFSKTNFNQRNIYVPSTLNHSVKKNHNYNLEKFMKVLKKNAPLDLEILWIGPNGELLFNAPNDNKESINIISDKTKFTSDFNEILNEQFSNISGDNYVNHTGILPLLYAKRIIILACGINFILPLKKLIDAKNYDPNWPLTALIYSPYNVEIYTDKSTYDILSIALKK
ncbi:MAG: hypothetical protein ACRCW6_02255 [Mycoplasmoidaceae bacterium]